MNFSVRSYEKELLDRSDIPFADIKLNMRELDFINAKLGGHKITLEGLGAVMEKTKNGARGNSDQLSILEIGCGGGDNLRVIKKFCQKKNIAGQLAGDDINRHCIEFARSRKENNGIQFICSDYKLINPSPKPDIIFNSLFCHHFTEDILKEQLIWMKENSTIGFFINDLHRHLFAYYSIKLTTSIFSNSYLVKNDASLSVARGFKKIEWKNILFAAGINNYTIQWKWAFRHLILYMHERK